MNSPIIFFSLFINDLVLYLNSKYDRVIFVTAQVEDMMALKFANDVTSFGATIVRLQPQIDCIQDFFSVLAYH